MPAAGLVGGRPTKVRASLLGLRHVHKRSVKKSVQIVGKVFGKFRIIIIYLSDQNSSKASEMELVPISEPPPNFN